MTNITKFAHILVYWIFFVKVKYSIGPVKEIIKFETSSTQK